MTPSTAPTARLDASSSGATEPAFAPPELYASLFVEGRSWKIKGRRADAHMEENGSVESSGAFIARCVVARVARAAWGVSSVVTCADLPDTGSRSLLAGHWYATPRGLFHIDEEPRGVLPPEDATLVLLASPVPKIETTTDRDMPDFGSKLRVFAQGPAWCHDHTDWGGDEAWNAVCIEPKKGFVSGNYGWAGGSSHEVTFTAE